MIDLKISTLRALISAAAMVLVLAACGGGGSGSGPSGGTSGSIASPNVSSATAGSSSVTLSWANVTSAVSYNLYWSTIPGVSKANGTKIPDVGSPYTHAGLTFGNTYYYVLTAVDANGTESAESPQVSAAPLAPPAGWSSGTKIGLDRSTSTGIYPASAHINDAGNAVVSWGEVGSGTINGYAYANAYAGGIWRTPTRLGDLGSFSASVAVTASGDAIAVYGQRVLDAVTGFTLRTAINSRRYDHLTDTWSVAQQISVSSLANSVAGDPSVAVDANGNAVAIWIEDGQTWARRFDAALGTWEASATRLSTMQITFVSPPKIVVDGSNIFTAVWIEESAAPGATKNNATVFARRFNATPNVWDATVRIGQDPLGMLGNLDGAVDQWVDVNSAGNVVVVWGQRNTLVNNGYQYSIDSARFDPVAKTWSAHVALTARTAIVSRPRVAVDSAGNAMAIWQQTEAVGFSLQSVRFSAAGSTWSAPMLTDQTGTGTIVTTALGMDSSGNAEVIWTENPGGIVERRYDAATNTWSAFNKTLQPGSGALVAAMSDTGYVALLSQSTDFSVIPWKVAAWGWIRTP